MLTLLLHAIAAGTQLLLRSCYQLGTRVQAGLSNAAQLRAQTREITFHTYMIS
ncbi:hypothetical protein [Rhodococcus opacus]|uniref:hypothetical protein n=1 Tax=Rhodococcus opacus TaxID=37919 RepID=UPI001300A276|nr:hypothetical protein [Rhodococcus opacus]